MKEVLNLLPVLLVAMLANIATGLYYNIGVRDYTFDKKKLMNGIAKAVIITITFISLAFCSEAVNLVNVGVQPSFAIYSAITIYASKAFISLTKILGIKSNFETK
ncbi:hypothetical protein [Lachnoclostridium sp.]|uniref:hypothetical protein n=1 Tax=Lachnoclostridium sp. TaxID=2028282 RepID=UPI002898C545|nr:hypothetical protein [Lachnoclostridium sp.]